jgi:hypothetical protein
MRYIGVRNIPAYSSNVVPNASGWTTSHTDLAAHIGATLERLFVD